MIEVKETARTLLANQAHNHHFRFKRFRSSPEDIFRPLRKVYQEESKLIREEKQRGLGPRCLGSLNRYSFYLGSKKRRQSNYSGYFMLIP